MGPFGYESPFVNTFLGFFDSIASKLNNWQLELANDFDKEFLLQGVQFGFKISDLKDGDYDKVKHVEVANHKSTQLYASLVEKELKSQIVHGNYILASQRPLVVSPLGAIKKEGLNEVRIIHDGSRPLGEAMNDYGGPQAVRYQTISDACALARPGCFLAKIDLKSAYRSVPIHFSDYSLSGIKWWFEGENSPSYLFDTRLPFGSNVGPSIFSRLTQSIRRMMSRKGFQNLVVYLDDFLIVETTFQRCLDAQHVLISLLGSLGFQISWHKVVGPSQVVPFLGIVIDTKNCTLSLDDGKVAKLKAKLMVFKEKSRANKRQLQSLAGSLNWACQAVRGGRYFLRRVLDLVNRLKLGSHKCRLSKGFNLDVEWWISALEKFNGTVYYRVCGSHVVNTDACLTGAGMFCGGDWAYINWKNDFPAAESLHINNKEILAVVCAAKRWAGLWRNCDVVVCTDSTVTKAVINKGTCRNEVVMTALRELFWLTVEYNFRLHAIHIPGSLNQLADAISRLHEPGQILQLHSLLRYWHHNVNVKVDCKSHMSPNAFQIVEPHILRWSFRIS